ncbi:MAG: cadherin-like beta sandwich domain-containing protein [Bacilli bacterium]|nr:cadherin-like beta sandwich domain-containing protein [Bacilli bacterium]
MKKIKIIMFSIAIMLVSTIELNAATFSMSSSTKQISPNGTFSVSVGGDCIGRVNLSVTNGTLSTSSVWVEQGYTTVTVTAGSSGQVTITATPETGFSDSDANIYNPGSRSVTVNIGTSSNTNTNNPSRPSTNTPTVQKSNDNNLSTITIDKGELSPSFNPSVQEYTINLGPNENAIKISATTAHNKAKVDGIGEKALTPGNNIIELTVTAENGNQKKYTIKVYVDESPQTYIEYQKKQIGIIRNYEGVTIPENFTKSEHTIEGKQIAIFNNEKLDIIYGIDEQKEKNFYLFDKEQNKILNKLIPITINNKTIYVTDETTKIKNAKLEKITINEIEVNCYKFEKQNYCLLNTINNEGKNIKYLYESSENSIQIYPEFLGTNTKIGTIENIMIYALSAFSIILISIIVYLIIKLKKGEHHEKTK